jgi:hypothetical protein
MTQIHRRPVEEGRSLLDFKAHFTSDKEGHFSFTLPPGTYTCQVEVEGFQPQTQTITLVPQGEYSMVLHLRPGVPPPQPGAIEGILRQADGTPLAGMTLHVNWQRNAEAPHLATLR